MAPKVTAFISMCLLESLLYKHLAWECGSLVGSCNVTKRRHGFELAWPLCLPMSLKMSLGLLQRAYVLLYKAKMVIQPWSGLDADFRGLYQGHVSFGIPLFMLSGRSSLIMAEWLAHPDPWEQHLLPLVLWSHWFPRHYSICFILFFSLSRAVLSFHISSPAPRAFCASVPWPVYKAFIAPAYLELPFFNKSDLTSRGTFKSSFFILDRWDWFFFRHT